jgi:hypothetical protein
MNAGGCSADCKVQCPGYVWPGNNHCYEVISEASNTLEPGPSSANGLCGQALAPEGHVVTFASDDEFRAVMQYFADAGASPFWVALEAQVGYTTRFGSLAPYEPGVWNVCSGCYAHLADPMAALPPAKAGDTKAFCVQSSTDPKSWWTGIECTGVNPYPHVLCEREPVGVQSRPCGNAFCIDIVWTYGQKTYVYHDTTATADEAEQECVNTGGRLVVLRSRDEREQLWRELGRATVPPPAIWIGLSQIPNVAIAGDAGTDAEAGSMWDAAPGSWVWDDSTLADAYASPWAGNEPHASGTGLTTRAYMTHVADLSDDTLAHNVAPPNGGQLQFVCEFPRPDGG